MTPYRAVIVDDEPLARQRIRDLLAPERDFAVAGECEDGLEALRAVPQLEPDVLFLDVQMPGIDGFDVLRALEMARPPIVVFVTAFDTYAVQAFDAHALDYLLKPLDADRFRDSVARVRRALAGSRDAWVVRLDALLSRLDRGDALLRRLVIKTPGRIFFVETREVDWFEAAGNYIRLHAGAESHLVRMTMQSLEQRLDPRSFARIHRSTIVNVHRIAELNSTFRGEYDVVLRSGARLPMQRAYQERLRAVIGEF